MCNRSQTRSGNKPATTVPDQAHHFIGEELKVNLFTFAKIDVPVAARDEHRLIFRKVLQVVHLHPCEEVLPQLGELLTACRTCCPFCEAVPLATEAITPLLKFLLAFRLFEFFCDSVLLALP